MTISPTHLHDIRYLSIYQNFMSFHGNMLCNIKELEIWEYFDNYVIIQVCSSSKHMLWPFIKAVLQRSLSPCKAALKWGGGGGGGGGGAHYILVPYFILLNTLLHFMNKGAT